MPVFFKQYGEQRTGTNYLKRLIELNFANAMVFASVLGWKHGLYEWSNNYSSACASHHDWLDHQYRDGVVYSVDDYPLPYSYEFLREASISLQYLVSIRELPQWVWSYHEFRHKNCPWNGVQVREWCKRYLTNYGRWASLLEKSGGIVIPYESLVEDPALALRLVKKRFPELCSVDTFRNELHVVSASTDLGLLISKTAKFDPSSHSNGFRVLPDWIQEIVESYTSATQELTTRLNPFLLAKSLRHISDDSSTWLAPKTTRVAPDSVKPGGIDFSRYSIAYNKFGTYCIPVPSIHRPAARALLAGGIWEFETLEFIRSSIGFGDIVHAGVYFGDSLPALSAMCGATAKIWAFEPNIENFQSALATIQINKLANIELRNNALGAKTQALRLVTHDMNGLSLGGASRIAPIDRVDDGRQTQEVQVVPLDAVVPSDRHVTVMYLDVEGYEKCVLAGAMKTVERCRPVLIMETPPASDWLRDNLQPLGYKKAGSRNCNTILKPV